jgi:flagellar hook-associated protein 1 FlgK
VTIVRVDDPGALPLPSPSDPNQQVVGVNFTGGMGSVVSQLNAALGTQLQFSNPSSNLLQVLNAVPAVTVGSLSATATTTSLTSGSPQLPLFLDGTTPITGAITGAGSQDTGLAARIAVNPAIVANPSSLIVYQVGPPTPAGDPTRPNFIFNQLNNAQLTFPAQGGSGGQSPPFTGTLTDYLSQVMSQQAQAANAATNLQQGQDIVVNALQQRLSTTSGVSIDQEMSDLITLQNTYGANARVMTTIQQLMTTLMQAVQ